MVFKLKDTIIKTLTFLIYISVLCISSPAFAQDAVNVSPIGSLATRVPPLQNPKAEKKRIKIKDSKLVDKRGRISLSMTGKPPATTKRVVKSKTKPKPDTQSHGNPPEPSQRTPDSQ